MGLQQENPHKNDDFLKIAQKSTFFLKNRFTGTKFFMFLKNMKKFDPILGVFKKAGVY